MSYIEFKQVSVAFDGERSALSGCDLAIEKGEFVFLVGRTGAGKSTLLKLLTGEVSPTTGSVMFAGEDLGSLSVWRVPQHRRKLGIVPQDYALLPKKTVGENIAYASRASGRTVKQTQRRVPFVLMAVDLLEREHDFPDQLSGGERQRVAIGRALINDPQLILADEPTGNLDYGHSLEIMKLLLELNARGATVIVASHDLYIIDKVRARVIELEEGKIVRDSGRAEVAPDSSVMQSERTIIEPETEKADDEPGTAYEVLGLEEDDAG